MIGPTHSFYNTNSEPFQPSQDTYGLWYQRADVDDYGVCQQPYHQGISQYPTEPCQQQDSYNNYDQIPTSVSYQNHPPSSQSPPSVKKPTPNKKCPPLMDREGEFDNSGNNIVKRRPGACTQCKKIKMKCEFPPDEKICKRCKPKGYRCIVEAPKPKVYLLSKIRQKDVVIESLLKQLYNPYLATPHSIDEYRKSISPSDANNPSTLAWLGRLKSSVQFGTGSSFNLPHGEDEKPNKEGMGRFSHEEHNPLSYGDREAQEHEQMHIVFDESLYVPVGLIPDLLKFSSSKGKEKGCEDVQHGIAWYCEAHEGSSEHGSSLCRPRELDSPDILVLGLVTLEDAEQLFDVKSSIYPIAMHFAKHSAARALIHDEMKSVELCQAYILMSSYAVPERSWERDLSWLYTGLAIRPWMMKEDAIIRLSAERYEQSHYALDYDAHTWGYNVLLLIVTRFHNEDFSEVLKEQWKRKFKVGGDHCHGSVLRHGLLHFFVAYSRLVMFSFGFHHVFHTGIEAWYNYFFSKSLECATSVIRCITEDLAPGGFMWYAPDRHFMCVAFAAVFLFKLLRPEFLSLLGKADKDESINLIGILIDKFSSSDIAVDDRHTPKLYARFLATLLSKYRRNILHEKAVSDLQTVPTKNTGVLAYAVAGEMSNDCGKYQQSQIIQDQNYDSSGRQWRQPQIPTYQPEATHAAGFWPQFGDGMGFLYVTHEGKNTRNEDLESQGDLHDLKKILLNVNSLQTTLRQRLVIFVTWCRNSR
ncbi:hypothetical protein EV421DRAFT_1737193 [Armillaria borealis]|uniref:Zn(2)-C6 fungal-type domain-containing protein n=1 Tax=Armillaria borealis TaxID=47425 RepID=A0AA39JD17_9AGAR|nr:hypothetical protein EV421DRAFT_1737193 [Armillaria borealis]